jgi:hypothetical protein
MALSLAGIAQPMHLLSPATLKGRDCSLLQEAAPLKFDFKTERERCGWRVPDVKSIENGIVRQLSEVCTHA